MRYGLPPIRAAVYSRVALPIASPSPPAMPGQFPLRRRANDQSRLRFGNSAYNQFSHTQLGVGVNTVVFVAGNLTARCATPCSNPSARVQFPTA